MAENDTDKIQCPIGKWYFKRMTLLGLLLLGFGGWFLYDGFIGYPKSQVKAVAYEAFKAGSSSTWAEYSAKEETNLAQSQLSDEDIELVKKAHAAGGEKATWADFALEKKISASEPAEGTEERALYEAFVAGGEGGTWETYATSKGLSVEAGAISNAFEDGGKAREWKFFAADHDLPSDEPYFHGKGDIVEQYAIGGLCAAAGLTVLIIMLLNRNRSISADGEAYYPKPATKVPFADVFRLDTRKWRRKGLAYAYYKDGEGEEQKAVLDDLKFVGTERILDRLMDNFEGELVEEVVEEEDDDSDGGEESDADPAPEGGDSQAEDLAENGERKSE